MKKKISLKLAGFIVAVLALFIVIIGFVNLTGSYVELFGNGAKTTDDGFFSRFPLGLFLIYIAMAVEVIGCAIWAIGYKLDPPTGTKTSSGILALRAFTFMPIILGLFTMVGGLVSDVTNETLVLFDVQLTTYLTLLGVAIMVVFGAAWWFLGLSRSQEKTCILLLGSSRSAKFLRDYRSELRKIVWPSRESTLKQTGVVLVALLTVAAVIGLLDLGFLNIIKLLAKI